MFIGQAGKAMLRVVSWDRIVLLVSIPFVVFLLFYNLEYNPRPWHDEGALLSVSRTLVEDGVYAGRSSDGYQTFGAVQSVGPTVLLPIALSFKLFGIGLVQGRVVVATYALLALALLYVVGQELFGRRIALVGVFLLLGSPAVAYLLLGRQVVGDAPALAFFLGGWLAWSRGIQTGRHQHYLIAGLLLGAAMVTKSQYILMGFGTLAILGLLDLVFYRQKKIGAFLIVGVVAGVCLVAWWGWQLAYYGTDTFRENAAKLSSLAAGT
ncbi:MAG: glycosyltransferase family 39 protein, partial [Anaerolineae bacterium]|nr:glycosyltransferase family 39 protein [Anaerolineae bacterium]